MIVLKGQWIPILALYGAAPQAQDRCAFFMWAVPSNCYHEYWHGLDKIVSRDRPNVDPKPKTRAIKIVRDLQSRIPQCSFLVLFVYYAAHSHITWLQLQGCQVPWVANFKFERLILKEGTETKHIEPLR